MRGKTAKKIRKFISILIEQTPPEQIDKTKKQMVKEAKIMWKQGKQSQKFITKVVKGEYNETTQL